MCFPARYCRPDTDTDVIQFQQYISGQPPTFETRETKADDTAIILYTSGTTGQPKGAELTHLNMVVERAWCRPSCARRRRTTTGRHATAVTLPLFHATAQTAQMLAYLHLGGTLVLLPRFDPAALLDSDGRGARDALDGCADDVLDAVEARAGAELDCRRSPPRCGSPSRAARRCRSS